MLTRSPLTRSPLTRPQLTRPQLTRPQLTRPQLTRPQLTRPQLTRSQLTRPQLTRPPSLTAPVPSARSMLVAVALAVAATAVSGAALPACGARPAGATTAPAAGATPRAAAEPRHRALPHPDLLRFVPAETPYLYAVLEPRPPEQAEADLVHRLAAYAPIAPRITDLARTHPEAYAHLGLLPRLAAAMTDALGGPVTARRLQAVGLDPATRLVVYGFLAMPVARIELSDASRFARFLDRVAGAMGGRQQTVDRRRYWVVTTGSMNILLAATDRHLIAALVPSKPTAIIARAVLSADPPVNNLAGDPRLDQVAADLDLSPAGIGWFDLQAVVKAVGPGLAPACRDELGALAKQVPGAEFGVREASSRRVSVASRVDLAPPLAASLAALLSDVPGNDPRSAVPAALSVAAAIDLPASLSNLAGALDRVRQSPYRCPILAGLNRMADSTVNKIRQLASDPLMQVRGLSVRVMTGSKLGVLAFIGTRTPLALARAAAAALGSTLPAVQVGDPPVRLNPTRTPMGPVNVVVRRGAVGVAIGGHDSELVELAGADPLPDPPLFFVHIMVQPLMQLASMWPRPAADPALAQAAPELARQLADIEGAGLTRYSEITVTGRATPRGLAILFASRYY